MLAYTIRQLSSGSRKHAGKGALQILKGDAHVAQKADQKIEKSVKSYIAQLENIGIHVQQTILLLKLKFRKRSATEFVS